jgi:hypothetical protein
MSERDPARLIDASSEAQGGLRSLLESAGRDGPSAAQRARLEANLAPFMGVAPLGQAAQGPVTTSAYPGGAGAVAAKIVGGLILAGAIGIGMWLLTRGSPEEAEQARAPVVEPAQPASELEPPPSSPGTGSVNEPPASAQPEPAVVAPQPPNRGAVREESSGSTEVSLLDEARQALSGSPAKALQLTRLHEQRFRGGALGQEREVIAIDALTRLGRIEEAKQRAERFSARYPGSAHQSKIDRLIGE